MRTAIHVVPGGVDTDAIRPGLAPLLIPGLRGTVFLSVFEWSYRKGWDILLEAWARAFSADDAVTLVLRTYLLDDPDGRQGGVLSRIDTFLAGLGRSRSTVAPIIVIDDPIPLADMPRLYATADAYVTPTRGEGWGRPIIEAMAAGLPVIATGWSGNTAFMTESNSFVLRSDLEQIDGREEFNHYHGHHWARPSLEHLVELLQHVAHDGGSAAEIGRQARHDAVTRWRWDQAADLVRARLDDIRSSLRRTPSPRPGDTGVRWVGDQFSYHSLSGVNREICRRLAAAPGVTLEALSREIPEASLIADPALSALACRTGVVLDGPADVEVRHQWPPDWKAPEAGVWVVIQPWEFGGVPMSWLQPIRDEVDELWCPSTYVRDCYVLSGVDPARVQVVPNGIDAERFRPDGPSYPLKTQKSYRFLFVGGTIVRKGIDLLLAAYADTFNADDDVCLVVKSSGSASFYQGQTVDDLIRQAARLPNAPEIELIDADLESADVAALYRSCQVLVHPYRGEGFALPVAEAMASGLPVIVTGYGACLDYCDETNSYLIPATPVAMSPGPDMGPSPLGYWWAEPDPGALRRLMRHVIVHPAEAAGKARRGRARIVEHASWDVIAIKVQERLSVLASRTPARLLRQRATLEPYPIDTHRSIRYFHHPDWSSTTPDQVVASYARAFDEGDDTALVLYLDPVQGVSADDAVARISRVLLEAKIDPAASPDIVLVPDPIDDPRRLILSAGTVVAIGRWGHRADAVALGAGIIEELTPDAWGVPARL